MGNYWTRDITNANNETILVTPDMKTYLTEISVLDSVGSPASTITLSKQELVKLVNTLDELIRLLPD